MKCKHCGSTFHSSGACHKMEEVIEPRQPERLGAVAYDGSIATANLGYTMQMIEEIFDKWQTDNPEIPLESIAFSRPFYDAILNWYQIKGAYAKSEHSSTPHRLTYRSAIQEEDTDLYRLPDEDVHVSEVNKVKCFNSQIDIIEWYTIEAQVEIKTKPIKEEPITFMEDLREIK